MEDVVGVALGSAGCAFADGPSALLTLKPGPGTGRPACAGLSAGASSAPHSTSGRRCPTGRPRSATYTLPAVAPATDAPTESPVKPPAGLAVTVAEVPFLNTWAVA